MRKRPTGALSSGVVDDEGQCGVRARDRNGATRVPGLEDRKSTRLNSSHVSISYAVFCLKKKKKSAKKIGILNITSRFNRELRSGINKIRQELSRPFYINDTWRYRKSNIFYSSRNDKSMY